MPDNLTPAQRSYCMSRNKDKDTSPEMMVRSELHRRGRRFRKHVKELPGKPDVVFSRVGVVIFVDGDFWHGYRFPSWEHKLSSFWKVKISKTRKRDQRNFAKLRRAGWQVVRVWEHSIEEDLNAVVDVIEGVLEKADLNVGRKR